MKCCTFAQLQPQLLSSQSFFFPKLYIPSTPNSRLMSWRLGCVPLCGFIRNSSGCCFKSVLNLSGRCFSQNLLKFIESFLSLSAYCLQYLVHIYNFGSSLAVLLELLRFVVHVTFLWQQCSVSHWSCSWQQFSYQIVACLRTFGSEHHLLRVPYCTSTFCSTLKVKDHCNLLG